MKRGKLQESVKYLILVVFALFVIYPFLWLLSGSFKSMQDLYANSTNLIPKQLMLDNYSQAWQIGNIGKYYLNSIIVTFSALAILMVGTYLAAYPLSRMKFPGRKWILIVFIACMMIPVQVMVIPLYKFETLLHINNTYLGLIFPYAASALPFSIFVLTAFLRTIPLAIEEAALIDGCNRPKIILNVLLPLSRPGLATVLIFSFMNIWNEFFLAMIIMQNRDLGTLNLGLLNFQRSFGTSTTYSQLFAALVMISIPVILVYAVFQKQFISGLTAGSVKT